MTHCQGAVDTMSGKTASYRMLPLLWLTVFSVACSAYIYFAAPLTVEKMAGVIRTTDGMTIMGWFILACMLPFAVLGLIFVGRALAGLPALKSDGKTLSVYVFPIRRIPLSEYRSSGLEFG